MWESQRKRLWNEGGLDHQFCSLNLWKAGPLPYNMKPEDSETEGPSTLKRRITPPLNERAE